MKKNLMMRAASVLLVAVMLTTCAISGTFAKYVTADDASDSARVAKFGVVVSADGTLFGKTYLNANDNKPGADDADDANVTVKASEKVVAPGTKSADNSFTFSIKGTPEVDVAVSVVVTNVQDVFLNGTGLPDMTTGGVEDGKNTDTFDVADYRPIRYTLWDDGVAVPTLTNVTIADLATGLAALSKEYTAGTVLDDKYGDYKITWEWVYDTTTNPNALPTHDQADTLLGDLAAGTTLVPDVALVNGTDYNLGAGIQIDITVTQVD